MADPVKDTRPAYQKKTNLGAAVAIIATAVQLAFPAHAAIARAVVTAGLVLMGVGGVDRASRYIEEWFKSH